MLTGALTALQYDSVSGDYESDSNFMTTLIMPMGVAGLDMLVNLQSN
jgi:hypothetical protein